MCELQDEIKELIVKSINTNVLDKKWKECNDLDALSKSINTTIIERKNIQGSISNQKNSTQVNYKFMEYTKWNNNQVCVGIGFNPATNDPNEIDGTNVKIINELNNKKYGRYILLNLYPQVSKDKNTFDETDIVDENFQNILLKILSILIKKKIDTLIFWGRTVSISEDVFKKLEELKDYNLLYMTVKQDTHLHYHPARITINIDKVTDKDFAITNQLKGNS